MSAAATAAGYLYASGRLRGRNAREGEQGHAHSPAHPQSHPAQSHGQPQEPQPKAKPARRREIKVAVYPPEPREAVPPPERSRPTPKIQYRTRRWKPE